MTSIKLNLTKVIDLDRQRFIDICETNQNYKFERSHQGELLIFNPTDSQTKQWIWAIASQLWTWNQQTGLGVTFDSFTMFELPNGAIRSPSLAWIHSNRWSGLTEAQRQPMARTCPDLVIELLSPDDNWDNLQLKMQEYQQQGVKLGWSIEPILKKIAIYVSGEVGQQLDFPDCLSGENVLPGFLLDLKTIFP